MSRPTASLLLHKLLILLGALSIPLYLWERHSYTEERGKFELALKAADAGMWCWDLSNGKIWWDETTFELFDVSPKNEPLNYGDFLKLIHPDDRERVSTKVEEAIQNLGGYQDTFRIVTESGTKSIRASGMISSNGRYMAGINLPEIQREIGLPLASEKIWRKRF